MIEILIVTPVLILIGAATVQLALLYHFKQGVIHGGLQASRAASVSHGDYDSQRLALAKSMVPWFGGGQNMAELQASFTRAMVDVSSYTHLEVVNPVPGDFELFKAQTLSEQVGKNVISQSDLWRKASYRPEGANRTKLEAMRYRVRLQYAAPANVPVAGKLIVFLMSSVGSESEAGDSTSNSGQRLEPQADPSQNFRAWALARGRIPITTEYETIMQSDLHEPDDYVSAPVLPTVVSGGPISPSDCEGAGCPDSSQGTGPGSPSTGGSSQSPSGEEGGISGCRGPLCPQDQAEQCLN